jgi:hypothetical protein
VDQSKSIKFNGIQLETVEAALVEKSRAAQTALKKGGVEAANYVKTVQALIVVRGLKREFLRASSGG